MPQGGLRRDRRESVAAKALPAAPPVPSNHAATSSRSRGGLLVIAGIAVMVLGVGSIAGGMLPLGGGDSGGDSQIEAASAHRPADDLVVAPCAVFASAETGGSFTHRGDCDAEDVAAQSREISPGTTPAPVPSGAPVTPEDTKSETTPESSPDSGAPAPGAATVPAQPSTPAAPPPTVPAAPAVQPLAFTGISEKRVAGLLGISVLSSYTLSVTGEPGSTAAISYGSANAGSVTFNSGGRASITLGGSLLSLGLNNPTIRAAYSDGTAGAEIQAARNSI